MNRGIAIIVIVWFFVSSAYADAAMTSTNYEIRWDTVSTGGYDSSSSTNYVLRDTVEPTTAGTSTSSTYQLLQGYRSSIDDQVISFEIASQTTSAARTATALSGPTVSASTSGISQNDLIAVVQDVGASQVTAVGRVSSIGSGTITVDAWATGSSAPTIDGSNDYVYPLTSSSISFGTLSVSTVTTLIVVFEVTAANDNGYVVQIFEDGNLRSGGNEINDVADGSVTAGVEEYGARSSDTSISSSTFDTSDTAMTSTATAVATESLASFESRHFMTLKIGIDQPTPDGSYSQILSLIASGNF